MHLKNKSWAVGLAQGVKALLFLSPKGLSWAPQGHSGHFLDPQVVTLCGLLGPASLGKMCSWGYLMNCVCVGSLKVGYRRVGLRLV